MNFSFDSVCLEVVLYVNLLGWLLICQSFLFFLQKKKKRLNIGFVLLYLFEIGANVIHVVIIHQCMLM